MTFWDKSIAFALLSASWVSGASSGPAEKKLFLLEQPQTNKWCAYLSENEWRSKIDQYVALEVATVKFETGHARTVKLTEEDPPEAGDWASYDTYQFGDDGNAKSLRRTTNVLPGHASRIEVYAWNGQMLARMSVVTKPLTGGGRLDSSSLWFPRRSVFSAVKSLPFHRFLENSGVLRGGETCL